MSSKLNQRSKNQLEGFVKNGWPSSALFTGQLTRSKHDIIVDSAIKSLYDNRFKEAQPLDEIRRMVHKNEHPDFYWFTKERIKIGESSKAQQGTVRHLLDHVLSYAPRYGKTRFVYFEDASLINDEAESALLKSLEEPPPNTGFILSAGEPSLLKETIVSRSRIVPLEFEIDLSKTPSDPWQRFWYLSRWDDTSEFETLQSMEWIEHIKNQYDLLNFSVNDYEIFENLGWNDFNKKFSKESKDAQSIYMKLTFLPLYFSVRDALIEGKAPSIGPVNLPAGAENGFDKRNLLYYSRLFEGFFNRLQTRYLNTRPPSFSILFFSFLSALMERWPK